MRSVLIWTGTLVGSVALGAGMYTLVVAPGTSGLDVSGTSAALPSPQPTVLRFKTDVVKDPPKKKIVDVPVSVTRESEPEAAPAPQVRSYAQGSADDDAESGGGNVGRSHDDESDDWSGGDESSDGDDSSGGGGNWSGGDDSSDEWESDDDSRSESGAGESDDDGGSDEQSEEREGDDD
ncbi:MAG: hypothetical protein V9E98_14010 [Candidatus Nanopelagicales bacterium]